MLRLIKIVAFIAVPALLAVATYAVAGAATSYILMSSI